jgi:glycosyltransferase involved in cell wall biosynthesis
MSTIEIAVIIPTYNRAHLIADTLDAILAQSYAPSEIVVVDDGSTDDTEAILARYASRVRYLPIKNSGSCTARNKGVAATTAPWLAFCDSDDLWHPDRLRSQVELCSNARDVQYCFSNFRWITGNRWSSESKFDGLPADYWGPSRRNVSPDAFVLENGLFLPLLSHQPVLPSTLLMTHSFFESAGKWNETLGRNPSEDIEFLFRCVVRPPIGVVTMPLVAKREHNGNWTRDSYLAAVGLIDVLEQVSKTHTSARQYAVPLRKRIQALSARAVGGAFAAGDFELARRLLASVPVQERSWKLHLRALAAHCPRPIGSLLSSSLLKAAKAVGPKTSHIRKTL